MKDEAYVEEVLKGELQSPPYVGMQFQYLCQHSKEVLHVIKESNKVNSRFKNKLKCKWCHQIHERIWIANSIRKFLNGNHKESCRLEKQFELKIQNRKFSNRKYWKIDKEFKLVANIESF